MDVVAYKILVPLLAFLSVVSVGASFVLAKAQKKKILDLRLQNDLDLQATKSAGEEQSAVLGFLERVGNVASHGQATTSLWEQLIRAGYMRQSAAAIYTGMKILLFLVGAASTLILILPTSASFPAKITATFVAGVFFFFIPNIVLIVKLNKRREEIAKYLPEAIDLLEICVSSGIGLDMAWNIVSDEIRSVSPVLAGSMELANFEMHLGAGRVQAMRRMADRTGVDQLSSLAAILIQTEKFGTSIADTLKVFAVSMRDERRYTVQENAEKMAVKLIAPMVLFIFPAVLIVIAGPAALRIAGILSS